MRDSSRTRSDHKTPGPTSQYNHLLKRQRKTTMTSTTTTMVVRVNSCNSVSQGVVVVVFPPLLQQVCNRWSSESRSFISSNGIQWFTFHRPYRNGQGLWVRQRVLIEVIRYNEGNVEVRSQRTEDFQVFVQRFVSIQSRHSLFCRFQSVTDTFEKDLSLW